MSTRKAPKVSGLVAGFGDRPVGQLVHPMPRLPDSTPTDAAKATPEDSGSGEFMVEIRLLDDSPYQHRRRYEPLSLDELSTTLTAQGQLEAIKIRRKPNGRYEILAGHRRTRAARSIGWTHLKAVVETLDEQTAAIHVMLSNEQHEAVGEYERACGYQTLIKLGLSQVDISTGLGVPKSVVSERLAFFKLPPTVLEVLDTHPMAMGTRNLPKLRKILDTNPGMVLLCAEGLRKVGEGLWTQEVFISSLLQKQSSVGGQSGQSASRALTITDLQSKVFATIKQPSPNGRIVEIKLADGVDSEAFVKLISNNISMLAQQGSLLETTDPSKSSDVRTFTTQ